MGLHTGFAGKEMDDLGVTAAEHNASGCAFLRGKLRFDLADRMPLSFDNRMVGLYCSKVNNSIRVR